MGYSYPIIRRTHFFAGNDKDLLESEIAVIQELLDVIVEESNEKSDSKCEQNWAIRFLLFSMRRRVYGVTRALQANAYRETRPICGLF